MADQIAVWSVDEVGGGPLRSDELVDPVQGVSAGQFVEPAQALDDAPVTL